MKYQRLKRNVGRSFSSLPTLHLSSSTSGQFVERVYLPFKTRIVLWWRVVLQKQPCACLILSASVCWKNKPGEKKKYACVAWLSLGVLDHRVPSSFDTLDMSVLAPPVHRGMTTLNREAFKKSFETLGVRLPAKKVGAAMKILSK